MKKDIFKNLSYFFIPFMGIILIKNYFSKPNLVEVSGKDQKIEINNTFSDSEINLVDFNFDVKPILSDKCYTCHGPDDKARKANLRLDTENGLYKALEDNPNHFVIDKNNLVESEILKRISSKNSVYKMPPPESNLDLSDREKEILKKWVLQGGKWDKHWAYIKPELPIVPEVKNINWTTNEIDYFILRKLESKGMSPSKIEEKEILLRRVYFDIIGLPPLVSDIDNFISDKSPNAYEKIIDKLLESEAYGERMASIWMDLSRYGDSHGYQDDQERIMWPWRDWVIHAYNSNMPYDEFITWQMAGDMLPNATKEQILASGFNPTSTFEWSLYFGNAIIGISRSTPFFISSQFSSLPTKRALTSPKVKRLFISFEFRVGKKGTEIYPAIEIAKSAIIHSLQFFDTSPI